MKVSKEISKRFLASILRLKGRLDEKVIKDIVLDYVLADVSMNVAASIVTSTNFATDKFSLNFKEEDYTVQASIILALMEASDNWKEFEKLHKKQKNRTKQQIKKPDKKLSDFDKILEGIMKVPKETKE